MSTTTFNRDSLARQYATSHLHSDPGIEAVHYLPDNAPDREIRLVEVNKLIAERDGATQEPIDFGIDRGTASEHALQVVDVTPGQWQSVLDGKLDLPAGWSVNGMVTYP